jgi:hypothetical protein
MKPNTYKLIERCIEDGVPIGYARAHKHTEKPLDDLIFNEIIHAVMLEISEWFDFDSNEIKKLN